MKSANVNDTILIVDDDIALLETTAYMVETLGHNVITAQNGAEAVEKYKMAKPALVFMDIKMPIMDGFEAFFKIKKYDHEAKIILITAYAMDERKHQEAQSMSLLDTIEKPYSIERIEDALKEYL
jgi:two-component system chemotaxis response regulator CheY